MLAQSPSGGAIVNTSSVNGLGGAPGGALYSAAKIGVGQVVPESVTLGLVAGGLALVAVGMARRRVTPPRASGPARRWRVPWRASPARRW